MKKKFKKKEKTQKKNLTPSEIIIQKIPSIQESKTQIQEPKILQNKIDFQKQEKNFKKTKH